MVTKLISAFPGTGKSFYTEFIRGWDKRVWDSDSSKFNKEKFPENYIKHIKGGMGFADIIFISSHKIVRDALVENNLDFTLVYPDRSIKEEYIQRYKDRGNEEGFVKLLESNWNSWMDEMENQTGCKHIKLGSNEYLGDKIK